MDDKIAQCLNSLLHDFKGKDNIIELLLNSYSLVKDKPKFNTIKGAEFLSKVGFYKNDNGKNLNFNFLKDNILYKNISRDITASFMLKAFREFDPNCKNSDSDICHQLNLELNKHIKKETHVVGILEPINLKPYKDDFSNCRIFYNNCIVEVTADRLKTISYKEFQESNKYVHAETIINRYFKIVDNISDFENFIKLSTNSKDHFLSVCTSIGYLIHDYKNPSIAKAPIITDVLSQANNEPNGRSGKGLIIKALSEVINIAECNGKNLDLKRDKFAYQNIEFFTKLFVIQDVSKGFDFEDLFSQITDSFLVERKHAHKMIIGFADSPKIAITTNYTIPQNTDSYSDRKHLIILNNYFNAKHKPVDEFGKMFFIQWNEADYMAFDSFMMQCVQLYLKHGLLTYNDPELKKQNLISNTSQSFVEVMESEVYQLNEFYSLKEFAQKLDINSNEIRVKSRIAMQWLKDYAGFKSLKIDTKNHSGATVFSLTKR